MKQRQYESASLSAQEYHSLLLLIRITIAGPVMPPVAAYLLDIPRKQGFSKRILRLANHIIENTTPRNKIDKAALNLLKAAAVGLI
jgi:hypothetical protein